MPPPGPELKTVTGKVPETVSKFAGIVTLREVELHEVGTKETERNTTTDGVAPQMKFDPVAVRGNEALFTGV